MVQNRSNLVKNGPKSGSGNGPEKSILFFSQKRSARSAKYFPHHRIVRASIFHEFLIPKTAIREKKHVFPISPIIPVTGKKSYVLLSDGYVG